MADLVLPPGIDNAGLTAAKRAFAAAVGAANIFFDDVDRDSYADKFAVDDAHHQPLGALAPRTVEEIQAIVRIASQYRLPLWPISRGKKLG